MPLIYLKKKKRIFFIPHHILRAFSCVIFSMECSEIETKAQTEFDRIDGDFKKFKEKVAEIKESKNAKTKEHIKLKK